MSEIKPIVLPRDNGPHEFVVEWWYFNGHLKDIDNGDEYSFMDCFFKVNLAKVNISHIAPHLIENIFKDGEYLHFAHSVVSDISKGKSYKEIQNISLISDDSFKNDLLFINYRNAHILGEDQKGEIIEIKPNDFYLKTKNISLTLESKKETLTKREEAGATVGDQDAPLFVVVRIILVSSAAFPPTITPLLAS